MFFRFFSHCFFIVFISVNFFAFSQNSETLKIQDINQVMQQIFTEHVSQKEMTGKILKHAFKVYIDQFDPNRMYLLNEEVSPYLSMSDAEADKLVKAYKAEDFSSFTKLNALIQKSIQRNRDIRKELEKKSSLFFQKNIDQKADSEEDWTDPDLKKKFPSTHAELVAHVKNNFLRFIAGEKKRYGENQTVRNQVNVLNIYETHLRTRENTYLAIDADGHPLSPGKQESLFVIHVLKALASSLDAHTTVYDPEEAYDMRVRLEKEFEGIGAVFKKAPEGVVVARLLDGGPAEKSGLVKVGDILVEVDGQSVDEVHFDQLMEKIRGQNGTSIGLTLRRSASQESGGGADKIVHVKLTRALIPLNDNRVDVSYETVGNGIIGMLTLHSFYQGKNGISSEEDLKKAIRELDSQGNLRGLILDLRENSGGFLNQAVKVVGLFITNGVVVISKYSNGEEKIYRDMAEKVYYQGPLVVLTSKATASAAEIVAQALQDYGVAIVVGDEHTYGKGTIQSQTITDPDGPSFIKVTVGKYYTVSGKTPQVQGVKADVVVPSQFSREHIGEEYLDQSIKADTIPSEYNDDLADIQPELKSWYSRYYTPTIQPRIDIWKNMLPTIRKNSEYRISHNKNYQTFLKLLRGEKVEPSEEESLHGLMNGDSKNFGTEDLQMMEAVNIVKDMIYLHAHLRNHPDDGLESSKATAETLHEPAR